VTPEDATSSLSGSIQFVVPNEGLVGFLFDQKHQSRIKRADPPVLYGADPGSLTDRATSDLLAAGVLLLFGLHQDDDIRAEVVVGEPISDEEAVRRGWQASKHGFLDLPTGDLRLHSFDTLPMGDNGPKPAQQGASIQVPAGSYRVTMYRGGGTDLIVLTPAAKHAAPNVLFGECLGWREPAVAARGSVAESVWSGQIVHVEAAHPRFANLPYLALNFDAPAACELKLAWGDRLLVEADGAEYPTFYRGDLNAWRSYTRLAGPDADRAFSAESGLEAALEDAGDGFTPDVPGTEWLGLRAHGPLPLLFSLPVGTSVRIRKGQPPIASSKLPPVRRSGEEVHGSVILATEKHVVLNILGSDMFKWNPGDTLTAQIGDQAYPVGRGMMAASRLHSAEGEGPPLLMDVAVYWGNPKQHVTFLRLPGADGTLPHVPAGAPVILRKR
jgi:hypothetical protein